ncbi:MAG: formylglycine-generating enzyme family protein [Thermodesulfobacteriota bacterium]
MYQHLHQPPPPLPATVPAHIRAQVHLLLAKTPQGRPSDALSVCRAFAAALTDEDTRDTIVIGESTPAPVQVPAQRGTHDAPPAEEARGKDTRGDQRSVVWHFSWRAGAAVAAATGLASLIVFGSSLDWRTMLAGRKDNAVAKEEGAGLSRPLPLEMGDMVQIPAGAFWMGCNEKFDGECYDDEKPGRVVPVDAFHIDRFEVTVAEYRRCVEAGRCSRDSFTVALSCNWGKEGRDHHPINCVNWEQAKTYCEWAGKRLPAEAEWEKAARGTDGRVYPWGNEWDAKKVNTDKNEDSFPETAPVGSFPAGASPYGVLDMSGNVFEWTADWYDAAQTARSLRGGSWNYSARDVRASNRYGDAPGSHRGDVGFRCAR